MLFRRRRTLVCRQAVSLMTDYLDGALGHEGFADGLRHLTYAAGWKKFEWLWHLLIRCKQVSLGLPLLERSLDRFAAGRGRPRREAAMPAPPVLREIS